MIDGIKIYGSPWTPFFYNWAFNLRRGQQIASKWAAIPDDTDILITHGPPYGVLDSASDGSVGCKDLLDRIEIVKPQYHIFGHIHEGYGEYTRKGTKHLNACSLNSMYQSGNDPIAFVFSK